GTFLVSVIIQSSGIFCQPGGVFWDPELTQGGGRTINVPGESRADFVFVPSEETKPELSYSLSPSAPTTAGEVRITANASDSSGISKIKIEGTLVKVIRAVHHCRTETYEGHEIELCDEDFVGEPEPISVECAAASCSYTIPRSSTDYYRYELSYRATAFDGKCNFVAEDKNLLVMKPLPVLQANVRNAAAYRDREIFLVSDQDWRTAFSLIPIAFGTKCTERPDFFPPAIGGGCFDPRYAEKTKVPLIIFHHEGPDYNKNFDLDSAIIFANQYKPRNLTMFVGNETINEGLDDFLYYWLITPHKVLPKRSGGMRENMGWFSDNPLAPIRLFDASDISSVYANFFSEIRSVLVCEDSYAAGILCASFASQAGLPLFFDGHFDVSDIDGKIVHVAGNVSAGTMNTIRAHALQLGEFFSSSRSEEFKSPYSLQDLSYGQPAVLTSPYDKEKPTNFLHEYDTATWGKVTTFWKMSMAAPLYTAAKGGLIKLLESNIQLRSDKDCNDSAGHRAVREATDIVKGETRYNYDFIIIASPPYIPDSYYTSCAHGWAQIRQQVDRQYKATARIYGITVTDASAYIMRSVFYDDIVGEPEKIKGLIIAHSIGPDEHDASAVIDYLKSSPNYDINCFIGSGKTGCARGTAPDANRYLYKNFIFYTDHGSFDGWSDTLATTDIPGIWNDSFLDLPMVFADACLTNNYWQGGAYTFGPNWIRKGAIAYYGAVGVANYSNCTSGYSTTGLGKRFMDHITESPRGIWRAHSLGEANADVDHCTEECCRAGVCWLDNCTYPEEYILLGDPALVPKFKPRD
ncbi:MAG: C25 family cysteine peptidase, partial [Candidatus Diapherotrites archaeon]|nr:C25 family cysteine peptidase [Candidatus Diapherotrites archaeon]